MKVFAVIVSLAVSLAWVDNASAANLTWVGGLFGNGSGEWVASGTTDQWTQTGAEFEAPPGPTDYAIILDDQFGGNSLLPYPTIKTDVGTINYLGVSLHSDTDAELTIDSGGALVVSQISTVGGDEAGLGNSFGTINVTGGTMVTAVLALGADSATGQGQINLDAGFVHAGTVEYGASIGGFGSNANIDIEQGAFFHLNGDRSGSIQGWVDAGFLTANNGTTQLDWGFEAAVPGLTSVWAVPEPASVILFSLGGILLAWRRRV